MAKFEIQGADGKVYEVEAPSMEAAAEAMASFAQPAGGFTDPAAVDDFRAASRPWPPTRRKACPLGLETSFPGRLRVPRVLRTAGSFACLSGGARRRSCRYGDDQRPLPCGGNGWILDRRGIASNGGITAGDRKGPSGYRTTVWGPRHGRRWLAGRWKCGRARPSGETITGAAIGGLAGLAAPP